MSGYEWKKGNQLIRLGELTQGTDDGGPDEGSRSGYDGLNRIRKKQYKSGSD